jgi:hypothetical protein
MRNRTNMVIASALVMGSLAGNVQAAEHKVTLTLGGRFCEFYTKDLASALKEIKGVRYVIVSSLGGHAIVTTDGAVKPAELVAAVKNVKGRNMGIDWYCTAKLTN